MLVFGVGVLCCDWDCVCLVEQCVDVVLGSMVGIVCEFWIVEEFFVFVVVVDLCWNMGFDCIDVVLNVYYCVDVLFDEFYCGYDFVDVLVGQVLEVVGFED